MDEFDNDAMAQAMGFASFGAQNPTSSKRRKFNPAADAVVAAPDHSTLPPKPPPSSASNAIPLGVRSLPTNNDEIDLDDAEDMGDAPPEDETPAHGSAPVGTQDYSVPAVEGSGVAGQNNALGARTNQAGRGDFRSRGQPARTNWWADYYDPSSVINPWERLEQERGLEPRGSWLTWEEAKSKA